MSAKLIDHTVELLYHEDTPNEIEVFLRGASYGKAVPLDVHVNSRIGRDWSTRTVQDRVEVATSPLAPLPPAGGELFGQSGSEILS